MWIGVLWAGLRVAMWITVRSPMWGAKMGVVDLAVNSGPTSSSQKVVDSHIAREPVYKLALLSVFLWC